MTFDEILSEIRTNGLKALAWKEPYASLMLHGKVETRVWHTANRDWVLICASKVPYEVHQVQKISGDRQFERILERPLWSPNHLGYAIALGKLVDCRPMVRADEDACFVQYHEPWKETRRKKQSDGSIRELVLKKQLWCLVFEHVVAIEPFPYLNGQRWTTPNANHIAQLKPLATVIQK